MRKCLLKYITCLVLLVSFISCKISGKIVQENISRDYETEKKEALELIHRVIPEKAHNFEVEFIPKDRDRDVFEIENTESEKILLRGNNNVSVASALYHYLKNYTNSIITWNGSEINIPSPLPLVDKKIHKTSPYKYRYYLNYCTFNYTMSWWDWERWQWEIDWMALHGINMPLALTGQNSIHRRVYKSLGFADSDLKEFFSGPAYFSWFWMGNLDNWGGPLPVSWMETHEKLQQKILRRERGLGMTPILPAFTGHVPPNFKKKFPEAKLIQTDWAGFPEVQLLSPEDSLFTKIGQKFIEEERKVYGTNHFYTSDTFNENRPPSNDTVFLRNISKKVYESMSKADAEATWIMQGWLFHFQRDFWKQDQIKALLSGIPDDKMIILDLWSEKNPMWKKTNGYYGKKWIWNMLHNFGGNVNMYGMMDRIAQGPVKAYHDPLGENLVGLGMTPEGIEQNPVIYELMTDNFWSDSPIEVDKWLKDYIRQRYNKPDAKIMDAWQVLRRTVYADSISSGGPESIIAARPTLSKNAGGVTTDLSYDPSSLLPAWRKMITVSDEFGDSKGFQYDLTDLTRQVLANYASVIQQNFAKNFLEQDLDEFEVNSKQFTVLIEDMDRLLATQPNLLLGKWLNDAKSWGTTDMEKRLFEKNARNLITTWGNRNSKLSEYANKQWSGLLNGYYRPRWDLFFKDLKSSLQQKKKFDAEKTSERIKNWEQEWIHSKDIYESKPVGNAIKISQELFLKYFDQIQNSYQH